jgi:hypothetical protein
MRRSIDGYFGSKQSDGSFNGMVGMLNRQEIDIAAAVFVPSKERSEAAQFLNPFATSM